MEKLQFDKYLGGEITLPREIEIIKLATARANEICAMTQCLENPQHTKLIFQKLPVHMRRRVMSHNVKRMPRRLREAHARQMKKSGAPVISKRLSRKYRRRPYNLLLEYNRRQRAKIWLESHIWHAKRFHMIEKWGYKLANYSNDRGYRANYRAIAKHCMIQDISYYHCVEITGPKNILTAILKNHSKNELSFGAKAYISGNREGNLIFYKKDGNPLGVISFLWKPSEKSEEEEERSIWIWVHPAFYEDVFNELITSFEFIEISKTISNSDNFSNLSEREYFNNINACTMKLLTYSLNRFRLRGPLVISILNNTLRLPSLFQNHQKSINSNIDMMEIDLNESWESSWYQNLDNLEVFNVQKNLFETFKNFNSITQLPRQSVIGLTVLDPRFFLPHKRIKSVPNFVMSENVDVLDLLVCNSPLWNTNVRNDLRKNFKTTCEINKLRSKNLVPGVDNDESFREEIMSKIPIILIQCPGTDSKDKMIGFNSGIDIILPAGWAMPFWLSFIYRCARPSGLQEYRSTLFESLNLKSPEINCPDTPAYEKESQEIKKELIEKYFRHPPNRRVNFIKLAISSPFYCEWKILIKEWTNQETVHVLRDWNILSSLIMIFQNFSTSKNIIKRKKIKSNDQSNVDQVLESVDKSLLVPIKIIVETRGIPKNFALICMPNKEDLEKFNHNKKIKGPVQQSKLDVFEANRKSLRKQHQLLLKKLMKKRAKARKEMKEPLQKCSTSRIKEQYSQKIRELWLPSCKEVRKSCDRDVMGYVVQGDFSFTESKGVGWGYVVMQTLLNLISMKTDYVLIRNTTTKHYRLARLEVINIHT